jgi:cobalt-zinc-cadmium efflux system membrane fusion protein
MNSPSTKSFILIALPWLLIGGAVAALAVPAVRSRLLAKFAEPPVATTAAHDDHAGHDHGHAGHDEQNSIELTTQAQANIGLKLGKVELTTFEKTISVPGMLRERPGRSTVVITAPLTGIVTQIFPILGEAVRPGQKLFELRLTHEELVQAQSDLLRVAEELDVVEREIARLQKIAADGGIAGRQVLERQYEQQNKQAVLRAQKQALLLHGLSEEQVEAILTKRSLLRLLTVVVPDEQAPPDPKAGNAAVPEQLPPVSYQISEMKIERGQSVTAGETMAVLLDQATLFVEGNAFDKDLAAVNRTVENGWTVDAAIETEDGPTQMIRKLPILYVAGSVDSATRTFHFYAPLANTQLRDVKSAEGHRFVTWRYRPGQRVQVIVPVEQWKDRIVLPADAVAQSGVETYVFLPNGDHFDRKPVHVEYRDRFSVVVANDGSVFPGDTIVLAGAQQMQLALKNKAAGPVDPHAGHNH